MKVLTIWFDNIERKKLLQDVINDRDILKKINFRMLNDADKNNFEITKYNILNVPTSMKIVVVEKGRWEIVLKGNSLPEIERIRNILWPKHRIYDVGANVVSQVREAFMPGLTIVRCEEVSGGIKLTINPTINEDSIDLKCKIQRVLKKNSIDYDELVEVVPFQKAERNLLSGDLLNIINRSFQNAGLKPPDFEWYPYPAGIFKLAFRYDNVFALGQGRLPAAMPFLCDTSSDLSHTIGEFQSFLKAFLSCA